MSLSAGTRVGAYEIVVRIGEGGMGEVYRAKDTKLGRDVAVKILAEAFVTDPERVASFNREAQILASLNHPNIAAIYGLEQADGLQALVLELVDGPTLADRIARGSLPAAEALPIARQIAEALEAAHEQGIVHRDLKPANVKLRGDEAVKVLDFGLAKLADPPMSGSQPHSMVSQSPTITSPAMTRLGIILGTAAYMSPEQARGSLVDRRTDVFSFGILLYEMLAGRRPFEGETASDVIASILAREPDFSSLPVTVDPRLIELVRRCLEKPLRKRWQAIGDVRAELETIASMPAPQAASGVVRPRRRWKGLTAAGLAALLFGVAGTLLGWTLKRPVASPVVRFSLIPAEGVSNSRSQTLGLSRDGSRIVFV